MSTLLAHGSDAVGLPVWDRLWRYQPSDAKDDQLLSREQRSPRWALIVEAIRSAFGAIEGLRTVELGSGRGDLSALLAQHGAKVTLVDMSRAGLDQARRRFERLNLSASYVEADLLGPLDELRGRFDVALSSGVIEHFRGQDRTRSLQAHHDVLCSGGLTVVSVPHAWCLPYRLWKLYLETRGAWPYGMEIPYSRSEITARAKDCGFGDVRAETMGFWQSVGDHWGRSVLGRGPDWVGRRSMLDRTMGLVLLLVARKRSENRDN